VGVGEVEVPYKVGQVESRWSPAEFATAGTDMKQFGESDLSNLELPGCVLLDKFPDCTPSLLQTSSVSNPGRNLTDPDPDPDPDPDLTLEFGKGTRPDPSTPGPAKWTQRGGARAWTPFPSTSAEPAPTSGEKMARPNKYLKSSVSVQYRRE
jgi:hypothetical protein